MCCRVTTGTSWVRQAGGVQGWRPWLGGRYRDCSSTGATLSESRQSARPVSDLLPAPGVPPALDTARRPRPDAGFGPFEAEGGADWRRFVRALWRYRWLVALVTMVGTLAAALATRLLPPEYRAQATIWIEVAQRDADRGPIRSAQLLDSYAWVDLLKSYVVLDDVVRRLGLYIAFPVAGDSIVFTAFHVGERFRPGVYRLTVDDSGSTVTLSSGSGQVLERKPVGDPVGQAVGFAWAPPRAALQPGRRVDFSITMPRDVARDLAMRLRVQVAAQGNFLRIELGGPDPHKVAAIVNAVLDRYVEVAAELKREKLTELTRILNEQLAYAERNLRNAEVALESFRVQTITLPSDRATPVTPGLEFTRDPVFAGFFDLRIQLEQVRRDREAIQRVLAVAPDSRVAVSALEIIGAVQASSDLMAALRELTTKQAELRTLRYRYLDEHPPVQRLVEQIRVLEQRTVPAMLARLVQDLSNREAVLAQRVGSASRELAQIPPRAIQEARLRREVAIAEQLFTTLQARYEEARLGEASSIPDVRVLEQAVAPLKPVRNSAPRLVLLGFFGSLGLGCLGAVLLDLRDPRVRYPDQITRGLGLPILGAVPRVQPGRTGDGSLAVIETLRVIRLNLQHAHGAAGPLLVTVSSPGSGDGKSFVVSNLALAFADAGFRTVLLDGDVRRGALHRVLGVPRRPGLTDYLQGRVPLENVLQATRYASLALISSGTRTRRGPELLASAAMRTLLSELRARADAILIDSSPLAAGADGFALATMSGNLLLVLRAGVTNRDLAEAKLSVLDRLPTRLLGTVLNAAPQDRIYAYYSYHLEGYEAEDEPAGPPRPVRLDTSLARYKRPG